MVRSNATTVDEYLAELSDARREIVSEVRKVVQNNLPPGYEEVMRWGMITWEVPLERYPDTYNGQPLQYAGLASQKNYLSLYLTGSAFTHGSEDAFRARYEQSGKKLDMGKSCVRFRKVDDLALDVIADEIASRSVDDFIEGYQRARG